MAHEDLNRDQHVEGSSDRAFGLVFAVVFLVIAGWPLFHGEAIRWWSVSVARGLARVALDEINGNLRDTTTLHTGFCCSSRRDEGVESFAKTCSFGHVFSFFNHQVHKDH